MLSRPQNSITTRSSPTPKPPCGGAPYLKQLMYDWMLSSGISCALALSADEGCISAPHTQAVSPSQIQRLKGLSLQLTSSLALGTTQ